MLLLWREDEGHCCCHDHLPTGPSSRTAEAAAARAAAPGAGAVSGFGHSVDDVVKFYDNTYSDRPAKHPGTHGRWALERPLSAL